MNKILIFLVVSILYTSRIEAQESYPTNVGINGLEKNILFNAQKRFTVEHTGPSLIIPALFDGSYISNYSTTAPTLENPFVITISGLPNYHIQRGAWIGWSTRYWPPGHFKIEGYNTFPKAAGSNYPEANTWVLIAERQGYAANDFIFATPSGSYEKLRITVYSGTGTNGLFGISELFFIHPEAGNAYNGLLPRFDQNMNLVLGDPTGTTNDTKGDLSIFSRIEGDEKASIRIGFDDQKNFEILRNRLDADIHLKANQSAANLRFTTNSGNFTFNGGKAGFGTLSPVYDFEVKKRFGIGKDLISSNLSTESDFTLVQHLNTDYSATIANGGGTGKGLNIRAGGVTAESVPLRLANYNNTEIFRVNGAGQLGLGTSNVPTGYKMAVNGNALFEKVVIRKNTNWPDYVFSRDYALSDLYSVEQFIKLNGHLPEIPSAKEIEQNGQDLGEMNKLLLKKVEELTLYLIEEKKRSDKLEVRLQDMELLKKK